MNSRAKSLDELETVLGKLFTEESLRRGLAFQPRPSDIIISPYAKSGTTWLQQIAHGLRTRGSMDFEEITQVTPWIEVAHDLGWDLDGTQVAEPRVYKSHLSWHDVPKGGRYICAFRHPYDVMVSYYRFFEGWFFEPGSISIAELTRWRWPRAEANEKGYWYHLSSWWEQRRNPNVLLFCYEDMREDLRGTIRRVAQFMGIELDQDLLDVVTRQSTREFMLANQSQFDEKFMRKAAEQRAGLPTDGVSVKVTPGAAQRSRYELPPAIKAELDEIWREQVFARFGLEDYGGLRRSLNRLHMRRADGQG